MELCLIRDAATYSWKRNGPAGTLRHNISHAYLGWWGPNQLFLSIHFVLFLRFLTIECVLPSQLEPWIWPRHLFTKPLSLEWIPDVNSCHRLSPIPVPNERTVALPEKSPAWYTEGGLGLTFLLGSVPCLSTKMLVTAQSCQKLPLGGVWRFPILPSGLMVP